MTVVEFRLSDAAVRILVAYMDQTGMNLDEAGETLVTSAPVDTVGRLPDPELTGLGEKKDEFLAALLATGEVSAACLATGISEGLPYGWARSDLAFARAFDYIRGQIRARRGSRRLVSA